MKTNNKIRGDRLWPNYAAGVSSTGAAKTAGIAGNRVRRNLRQVNCNKLQTKKQ